MRRAQLRVAIVTLTSNPSNSYTVDWARAFHSHPDLRVNHIELLRPGARLALRQALRNVDAAVVLHSVTDDSVAPLKSIAHILSTRSAPLAVLVGNEINLPWAPLSQKVAIMAEFEPEVVGTQLLQEAGEFLYGSLRSSKVVSLPHAVDTARYPYAARPSHTRGVIGTRSARYLPILGDQDRPDFFSHLAKHGPEAGWTVDISENRLEGGDWIAFLRSLDGTVGTEAGSFFTKPTDEAVLDALAWARYQIRTPSVSVDGLLRRMTRRLPWRLRQWARRHLVSSLLTTDLHVLAEADSEALISEYFPASRRSPFYMKAMSSRHVEAASLGVPQILLEGRYNDVLIPDVHYFSVRRDLSNLTEVLTEFRDPRYRQEIAQQAAALVRTKHSLSVRIASIIDILLDTSVAPKK